jgi:hypothetical protein
MLLCSSTLAIPTVNDIVCFVTARPLVNQVSQSQDSNIFTAVCSFELGYVSVRDLYMFMSIAHQGNFTLRRGDEMVLQQATDSKRWLAVHYTGTLTDGSKFDSSVDRDEPFSFTLGHSQVIKGWDKVVATMKKGEKVQVTLAPQYAYGESGSHPKIPPSATLVSLSTFCRCQRECDCPPCWIITVWQETELYIQ